MMVVHCVKTGVALVAGVQTPKGAAYIDVAELPTGRKECAKAMAQIAQDNGMSVAVALRKFR